MFTVRSLTTAALIALLSATLLSPPPLDAKTLHLRVVDAGPGLCTVAVIPGKHYLVYDTGHWDWAEVCYDAVEDLIPKDETIDLMVLSHRDSDHLAATDEILAQYRVDTLVRTGNKKLPIAPGTWRDANKAIGKAKATGRLKTEWNLYRKTNRQIDPGFSLSLGPATATFVIGYHKPPRAWGSQDLDRGWKANAGSIVVRLTYAGESILLTGDAVGRRKRSADPDQILATEKAMVDNANSVAIASSVLVAPHHGANNGSSQRFIEAVNPDWVIFSSGSSHQHPTEAAAERYLTAGVPKKQIFRTDKGDYESGSYHWQEGTTGAKDLPRDDDVEIYIRENGKVCVEYRGTGVC